MEQLANPGVLFTLGFLALLLLGYSLWIAAIDVALARMSFALAEDLEEEGRKNADQLRIALELRRESRLALRVPQGLFHALAHALLAIVVFAPLVRFGALLSLALALMANLVVESLFWVILNSMLAGELYVGIALRGSPTVNRMMRRSKRQRERHADSTSAPASTTLLRLEVAEELRELVDEVSEGIPTALDEDDRQILKSVFELGATRIGEVMVPRGEMVVIQGDEPASNAIKLFVRSGFSRIPVIGKSIDDVIGVVYFKDVVRRISEDSDAEDARISDFMRQAAFVPEMKLVDDEMRVMQSTNNHLALVVDEYGGIAGLVTVEDIIEELVGELTDEHDHAEVEPQQIGEDTWVVPSNMGLDDFAELMDVKIDEDDIYSVGGLLAKLLGKVPLPGAVVRTESFELEAGPNVGRRRQVLTIEARKISAKDPEQKDEVDDE